MLIADIPDAVASITFKADQVVSGVAINFLALGLSIYLVKYLYDGAGKTPTVPELLHQVPVPLLSDIPVIGPSLFGSISHYLSGVSGGDRHLYRVVPHLLLDAARSAGEHPHAAETAGINVIRMRYIAVMISGALAAAGGAGLSIAIGSEFGQTTVSGQGFISLAALIFGNGIPSARSGVAIFLDFPFPGVDRPNLWMDAGGSQRLLSVALCPHPLGPGRICRQVGGAGRRRKALRKGRPVKRIPAKAGGGYPPGFPGIFLWASGDQVLDPRLQIDDAPVLRLIGCAPCDEGNQHFPTFQGAVASAAGMARGGAVPNS